MKICKLRVNRMKNPIGFAMDTVRISFVVEESTGKKLEAARILIAKNNNFCEIAYDSGKDDSVNSICQVIPFKPEPHTRYYWKVRVWTDSGEIGESETAFFETAKAPGEPWHGRFITAPFSQTIHPVFSKTFTAAKPVKSARFYGVGLGVYELYLNGGKVGDEYLLPGIHAFDSWLQYQTFVLDVREGKNEIRAVLGDGWYKGAYGLKSEELRHGDEYALIGEIHIAYQDGSKEVLGTDESWNVQKGKVLFDGIYDGEIYDERGPEDIKIYQAVRTKMTTDRLQARLSPRIVIHEKLKPSKVIHTPKNETVLDFGQNMVGWVEFQIHQPVGTKIFMQFGEILQDNCFYRDNLRTAKCEYTYISDGTPQTARAHFTFYGFRYVKIEGWQGELNLNDFTGCVIHSEMEETGYIETSDPLVNRLIANVRWGQKGNFLDTPTDCPQRDERMGWTGDAQIFCDTASFTMDTYAFYTKFLKDLAYEQQKCGGSVPYVVPMSRYELNGASAWGDAATIIPWTVYVHFGDKEILRKQYQSMKDWVDYIRRADIAAGNCHLWKSGRHFGDWLALDGKVDGGVYGGTDQFFIASAYYYYSAWLTAKAAKIIGLAEDAAYYGKLATDIKEAFGKEYFTPSGKLAMDTQAGYAVVIFMGLIPPHAMERTRRDFREKMKQNAFRLNTGFVGTPYLCLALAESGYQDIAYELLMNENYPGWLYEVKHDATTIWERWNSVLPDGKISGTGMNSLNHYAYGAVGAWMYRHVTGIQPLEEFPGFKKVCIAMKPGHQLRYAKTELETPAGRYLVGWKLLYEDGTRIQVEIEIPFGASAEVILPRAAGVAVETNTPVQWEDCGSDAHAELETGHYVFTYAPNEAYRRRYGMSSNLNELLALPKTREIILKYFPKAAEGIPFQGEGTIVEEISTSPFAEVSDKNLQKMKVELEAL